MSGGLTPGPWHIATSNSWRRIVSRSGNVCEPVTQADGHPDLYFRNGGEEGPDARLMIAAPDLLEALEIAFDYMSDRNLDGLLDESDERDLAKIRAAICKATGAV